MTRWVLAGTVIIALGSGAALAQATQAGQKSSRGKAATAEQAGHTAPNAQPDTDSPPTAPTGEMALGTVRITTAVKADGKPLPAGTYQLRLTPQSATPDAKGQTGSLERWVEFRQGTQVKGREVVSIVPQSDIGKVQKDAPPPANQAKVQLLKGGDYYRVWINKAGNHYLLYLPPAA